MVERNSLVKENIRQAIVGGFVGNIDRKAMDDALAASSRKRQDAICGVLRQAARKAPMVMIDGEQHVYVPQDGLYHPFTWNMMADALYDAMCELGVKDGDFGRIDQIVRFIIRSISSKDVLIDNSVVVMSNGVYDTNTHTLEPFSDKYIAVSGVGYPYLPGHMPTRWEVFLSEVLPDREHRRLLQQCVALAYIDRTKVKIEYLTILQGSGANGKSVVFNTVINLLGLDNVSTFSVSDLINQKREQNIAACNGKRMNYCSEIRTSEINEHNSDAFKALVSGEPTMARALYHEPFMAMNIPILFANANQLPRIADPSKAIQRRIVIIPFDVHIPEDRQDRELPSLILDELSYVFNWAMEGLKDLQANGYRVEIPEDVSGRVTDYVNDINSVSKWLRDKGYFSSFNNICRPNRMSVKMTDMYKLYLEWCHRCFEEPYSKKQFATELAGLGFGRSRGANGVMVMVYMSVSEEEVRALAMQEAMERQIKNGVTEQDAMMEDNGVLKVKGVQAAERHLGLQPDSLLFYVRSGELDDTYEYIAGFPVFDVKALQVRLADIGYYTDIKEYGSEIFAKCQDAKRWSNRHFNDEMRRRGLPFYKAAPTRHDAKQVDDMGRILVPEDWEYSEDGVQEIMDLHQEKIDRAESNIKDKYF